MITPWIIDAKDIDGQSYNDAFSHGLLLRNEHVNQFLNPNNRSRFLVVAPKGYGKTLLLKGRRLAHQGSAVRVLPDNALVERPVGTPHVISAKSMQRLIADLNYWKTVWIIALGLCCLKRGETGLRFGESKIDEIMSETALTHACDIFARILQLRHREYSKVYEALNRLVIPKFRAIRHPTMLFIDNVDEYFQDFLSDYEGAFIKNVTADAWNFAQAGLALAARELHGINHHVRIYASIRKEVIQLLSQTYPMAQQLRGSIVDLSYSDADLIEIMRMNIRAEPDENLADPSADDEFERFVGKLGTRFRNPLTLEDEGLERFWLRYTLRRPRDIVQVGQAISILSPANRTPERVCEVIQETGRLIALSYLAECRPHLEHFDERILYGLLPSNVLSRDTMTLASLSYDEEYQNKHGVAVPDGCHVFCNLYRIGLLGYVRVQTGGHREQSFSLPGEQPYGPVNILPDSSHYLVHPVLDEFIGQRNAGYLSALNTFNVIERGRAWRRGREVAFVLVGDVVDFSRIMKNVDLYRRFPEAFARMAEEASTALRWLRIEGGDRVLLIDPNPLRLFDAARQLNAQLLDSIFQTELRFGAEAGAFDLDPNHPIDFDPSSLSLRTAARLEPFARAGTVLLAETFAREMEKARWPLRAVRNLLPTERTDISFDGEKFLVSKGPGDEPIVTSLFEVDLHGPDTTRQASATSESPS